MCYTLALITFRFVNLFVKFYPRFCLSDRRKVFWIERIFFIIVLLIVFAPQMFVFFIVIFVTIRIDVLLHFFILVIFLVLVIILKFLLNLHLRLTFVFRILKILEVNYFL